jgi:hypothetical protein
MSDADYAAAAERLAAQMATSAPAAFAAHEAIRSGAWDRWLGALGMALRARNLAVFAEMERARDVRPGWLDEGDDGLTMLGHGADDE